MEREDIEISNQLCLLFEQKLRDLREKTKKKTSDRDPNTIVKDIRTFEYKIEQLKKRSKKKEEYA